MYTDYVPSDLNALWFVAVFVGVNVIAFCLGIVVDKLQNRPRKKRRLPR